MQKAVETFQAAIKLDPAWAPLYSGLSDSYTLIALFGWGPSKDVLEKARASAQKSLALDSQLGEGHTSLALAVLLYDQDPGESQKAFKRAIELNPGYMTAHHFYAHHRVWTGHFDEANEEIRRALDLDPLSVAVKGNTGWFSFLERRYASAIDQFRRLLELEPNYLRGYYYLSCSLLENGDHEMGLEMARTAQMKSGGGAVETSQVVRALARSGKMPEARREFDRLRTIAQTKYVSGFDLALAAGELGEISLADQYINRSFEERASNLILTGVDPRWDKLKRHPKLRELHAKLGLA